MGRVFLAVDERLGRKVAIKELSPRFQDDVLLRERFMQEARAMARLKHPHIAHIYSLGQADEPPHFVMEYVEGAPLREAAQALTLRQKVGLMHKVITAADFLHQHQVIHRDLKPGNILVGPDLEPKVLDFGLALELDDEAVRLTLPGTLLGTPDYFSPEQARASVPLDARSDVFSLGTIFYELLTSELPFRGETLPDRLRRICEEDPLLPRRIDPSIPGELQNICLKALEKNPTDRYNSAREMANDVERFLAGEPVLAVPTAYARLMAGKIDQHLRELRGWRQDQIVSEYEFDAFQKLYGRLMDQEDAWIMAVRRLTFSQVSLYFGAWILVLGAVLVMLFSYPQLAGTPSVLVVSTAAAVTAWIGVRCWREERHRIAIAYLLAFCLLLPVALLVGMDRFHLLTAPTRGDEALEFFAKFETFKRTTNAQLWWSILLSLPAYLWLRRFTRASVFSLVLAVMSAVLTVVTLLRMGMLGWLDTDPGRVYLRLIPFAVLFF
ncbi:MAG TPA: serine/threonine-protein kinase, partial [Candidatus Acidoferrum sp.]|nr:serine/threonine-protein kinase [Candidatus Acidoferrum sp.]